MIEVPLWVAVTGVACSVLGLLLPVPLILLGRTHWWTWVGIMASLASLPINAYAVWSRVQ